MKLNALALLLLLGSYPAFGKTAPPIPARQKAPSVKRLSPTQKDKLKNFVPEDEKPKLKTVQPGPQPKTG